MNVPLLIEPSSSMSSDIRDLYIKLPEHMYEEHRKEYLVSNDRIKYDVRSAKNVNASSLPNTMTRLYNAGVYSQLITSLVDHMIVPATHTLDLKTIELDREVSNSKKSLS